MHMRVRHILVFNPPQDALEITSCHLFAMSMTCDTALELSSKYPDRVLSMTLCSPLPRQDVRSKFALFLSSKSFSKADDLSLDI